MNKRIYKKVKELNDFLLVEEKRYDNIIKRKLKEKDKEIKEIKRRFDLFITFIEATADFKNGVTCQGIDEGEVGADKVIAETKKYLLIGE